MASEYCIGTPKVDQNSSSSSNMKTLDFSNRTGFVNERFGKSTYEQQ